MVKHGKNISVCTVAAFLILGATFSFAAAEKVNAQSTDVLREQISALLEQIKQLQNQLDKLQNMNVGSGTIPAVPAQETGGPKGDIFLFNLGYGMVRSPESKRLQDFLIEKNFLLPMYNTGNYLSKTVDAVKKYQQARGISPTGYFGTITREVVNSELRPEDVGELHDGADENLPRKEKSSALSEPRILLRNGEYAVYARPEYDIRKVEKIIQDFVNEKRRESGVAALSWSENLANVARRHSEDQAIDNKVITATNKPCSYPYIRHEGFSFGFSLADRLRSSGILFRVAGENIAAFSVSKNFIYQYRSSDLPVACPDFESYLGSAADDVLAESKVRVQESIAKLVKALEGVSTVEWVNKEWQTEEEIAREIVGGWIESAGHRKNMLDNRFFEGGVGITEVNDYFIATHVLVKRI